MTRLPHEVMCDICGGTITPQQRYIVFNTHLGLVFGEPCHSHTGKCEDAFRAAQKSGDWKELLPGPLRTLYEQANTSYGTSSGL
ncbi:MAG: hypothetical protein PHH85_02270 [Candidatus Methanoperedens sp.]|nr:hypothetical protein [Candidatus Methanoperedens sp.]